MASIEDVAHRYACCASVALPLSDVKLDSDHNRRMGTLLNALHFTMKWPDAVTVTLTAKARSDGRPVALSLSLPSSGVEDIRLPSVLSSTLRRLSKISFQSAVASDAAHFARTMSLLTLCNAIATPLSVNSPQQDAFHELQHFVELSSVALVIKDDSGSLQPRVAPTNGNETESLQTMVRQCLRLTRYLRSLSTDVALELPFPPRSCDECAKAFPQAQYLSELVALQEALDAKDGMHDGTSMSACLLCPNRYYCARHRTSHNHDGVQGRGVNLDTSVDAACSIALTDFTPCTPEDFEGSRDVLNDLLRTCFRKFECNPFLGDYSEPNEQRPTLCGLVTYQWFWKAALATVQQLRHAFSLDATKKVVIAIRSSPLFVLADVACCLLGCVTAPCDRGDASAIRRLGEEFGFTHVIVEKTNDGSYVETPATIATVSLDSLDVILADCIGKAEQELWVASGLESPTREVPTKAALFGLFPTSGTTSAVPKYATYTREKWIRRLLGSQPEAGKPAFSISVQFAPLTHFSARSATWDSILSGGTRILTSPSDLFSCLTFIHPTGVFLVPVLWEQLYRGLCARTTNDMPPTDISADELFGQRCMTISTGTAPTPAVIAEWLQSSFGDYVTVVNGYGSTEIGGPITSNGTIAPGTEVRIDDDGVVWAKREGMFDGYARPQTACEGVDIPTAAQDLEAQGFFNTGDLGFIAQDGTLHLTGRAHGSGKLSNGMYCRTEVIEQRCVGRHGVSQCYAHVSSVGSFVILVVYIPALSMEATVKERISKMLASDDSLRPHEVPFDVVVLSEVPDPLRRGTNASSMLFSVENGLLTPSMKLRRKAVSEALAPLIGEAEERILAMLKAVVLDATASEGDVGAALSHSSSLTKAVWAGKLGSKLSIAPHIAITALKHFAETPTPRGDGAESKSDDYMKLAEDLEKCDLAPSAVEDISILPSGIALDGVLLLTGANGFVGSFLLQLLLLNNDGGHLVILCPVRCGSTELGWEKVRHKLKEIGSSDDVAMADASFSSGKLHILSLDDDVGAPLKLPPGIHTPNIVIHVAAQVSVGAAYSDVRRTNIEWPLSLRRQFPESHFVFVSSNSARPAMDRIGVFRDRFTESIKSTSAMARFVLDGPAGDRRIAGYGLSKALAELSLRCASPPGPLTILRLPFIWCDTERGVGNATDSLYRFTASLLTSGCYFTDVDALVGFPVLPVNSCAQYIAMAAAARCTVPSTSRCIQFPCTIHLPYRLLIQSVRQVLSEHHQPEPRALSYTEWYDECIGLRNSNEIQQHHELLLPIANMFHRSNGPFFATQEVESANNSNSSSAEDDGTLQSFCRRYVRWVFTNVQL